MKALLSSIFSSHEFHTCAMRIDEIIESILPNDPFILKVKPLFKIPLADLTKAIGRTTDSVSVELLGDADDVRDTRYLALRNFCNALTVDKDKNIADAATYLTAIIRELGWSMHRKGKTVETSLLKSMFEKFDKAPASTHLTTTGAQEKYADLKTAQAEFEDTFYSKVDAKTQEVYPLIRSSRQSTLRYLDALLSYIDMLAEIDKADYLVASQKIDEVITELEAIARARITRKENEKKNPPKES